MKSFCIAGKDIVIDDTIKYKDFYKEDDGQGKLVVVDMIAILTSVEQGKLSLDDFKEGLDYLKRWVVDAPRKRFNRSMRKEGYTVITTDELFENLSNGEEIIDDLEKTGKLAQEIYQTLYT